MLLQELAKRMFPLCESFMLINQFVESRSQFKNGLVNHAFAAALRALLVVGFLLLLAMMSFVFSLVDAVILYNSPTFYCFLSA